MQKLQNEIRQWSDNQFGLRTGIPIACHLRKESDELIEALKEYEAALHDGTMDIGASIRLSNKVKYEFADCLMLLLDAAAHTEIDVKALIKITNAKLKINKHRNWGKPNKEGFTEHI